jgi:hypothetical protein
MTHNLPSFLSPIFVCPESETNLERTVTGTPQPASFFDPAAVTPAPRVAPRPCQGPVPGDGSSSSRLCAVVPPCHPVTPLSLFVFST